MSALEDLVARYRRELSELLAHRGEIEARIQAKQEVLDDLEAALGASGPVTSAPPRRGRITQADAVVLVLSAPDAALSAGEIYAAAVEAGAGGSERSLRNVLSRKVRDGELAVDRRRFPQRYRLAGPRADPTATGS